MTTGWWVDLVTGWTYAMTAVGAILLAVLIRRLTNPAWRREYLGAADDAPTEGSTVPIGEPQPAPALHSGAGTDPGTCDGAPVGGSALRGVETPSPASGTTRPDAGPTPPAGQVVDGMSALCCPDRLSQAGHEGIPVDGCPPRVQPSTGPTKRPVAVAELLDPTAATDLPPGPSDVAADGPVGAVA